MFIYGFTADFLSNIKRSSDISENNYSLIYDKNNPKRKIIWGNIEDLPVELFPLLDKNNSRIKFDTSIKENRWDYVNDICKQVYNMKNAWAHKNKEEKVDIINNFAKNLCYILGKTNNIPTFNEDFFEYGKDGTKKRDIEDFQEEVLREFEEKCTVLMGRVVFINEEGNLEDYIVSKGRLRVNKALMLDKLCDIEIEQFQHRAKSLQSGYLLSGGEIILADKYLGNIKKVEFDNKKHIPLTYIDFKNIEINIKKGKEIFENIINASAKRTRGNWTLFWLTLLLPYSPKCAFNLIGKPDLGKTTLVENLRKYIKVGFTRKGDSERFNAKLEGNILTVSDDINLSKSDKRKEKSRNASNVISIERKGKEEIEQLYLANRLIVFNEANNVPWGPQDLIKQKYIFLENKFDFDLITEENIPHLLGYLLVLFFKNKNRKKLVEDLFDIQKKLHWTSIESLLVENAGFFLSIYDKGEEPLYGFNKYDKYKITQGKKYLNMLSDNKRIFVINKMKKSYDKVGIDIINDMFSSIKKSTFTKQQQQFIEEIKKLKN